MFDKSGEGPSICECEASQGKVPTVVLRRSLTHSLQEAEQAAYASTQVAAGQAPANAPVQHVQRATSVTETGTMDVDEDTAAQGTVGEGHSGIKRKAGEETESAFKKQRMGMFIALPHVSAADTRAVCRTCHCSFEKVNSTTAPSVLQLLTRSCRDRENCTVFVSDLPGSAMEDDLKTLFKDVRSPFYSA